MTRATITPDSSLLPLLHPITGQFRDRALESAFRESILGNVQRASRFSLIVAAAIILSFTVSDFSYLGLVPEAWALVSGRLVTVASCLFFACYLSTRPVWLTRPWLHGVAPMIIAVFIIMIVPLRPMTLATQLTAVTVTLLALYLFIPNLLQGILLASLTLSAGFLLAAWIWADLPPVRVLTHGLLLAMANLVGYGTALRLARLERTQFALLRDERRANERLINEVAHRQAAEKKLRRMAERDDLTGIANRRHFMEEANDRWRRARASGWPFSLCMFDLDHFKRINDTWGHDVGDQVLRSVARACEEGLRPGDLLGRIGGEEFIIACPDTDLDQACRIAERLRKALAELTLPAPMQNAHLTVTFGVAQTASDETTLGPAIKRADDALYRGKRAGRDRMETQPLAAEGVRQARLA